MIEKTEERIMLLLKWTGRIDVTIQTGLCTCCKVRENTFQLRRIRHFAEGKL